MVFWRGKLTGMHLDEFSVGVAEHNPRPEKVRDLILENPWKWQRAYLCYLSAQHPDLIDSKMMDDFPLHSQLMGFEEHGWHKHVYEGDGEEYMDYYLTNNTMTCKDKTPIEDHMKYKYLISIDGNTAAWQRPNWILESGSVLLMPETEMDEWYLSDLKPWVHYVPIKADLSDLLE